MNVKELLLGLPVLIFVLWVFAAPLPQDRISRSCEPISWVGNLTTSTTALTAEGHTGTAARWSDKLSYSCKYMIWRLVYQDAYLKAVQEGRVPAAAEAASSAASAASAPAQATAAEVVKAASGAQQ